MKYRYHSHSYYGFTTVELVVSVLFIGVLAVIAINSFSATRVSDRDERRIEDITSLQKTLADYFDKFGGYPSSLNTELVRKGFIETLPVDPQTGEQYLYSALNVGCTSYHLGAVLEDKQQKVLDGDKDIKLGVVGTNCPDGASSVADFKGDDPIYDVKP